MKPDCLAIVDAKNDTLWVRSVTYPVASAAEGLAALRTESPGEALALIKSYVDSSGKEVHIEILTPWADAFLAAKNQGICPPGAALVEVWHDKKPSFGMHGVPTELSPEAFQHCADLMVPYNALESSSALDCAYAESQNIHHAWRPGAPNRSTSVGDVLVLKREGVQKAYVVASIGFEEVTFSSLACAPVEA